VFSEIFLSIPQASFIHSFIHYPSHFPTHYQWYVFIFCEVFDPKHLKAERKAITPNMCDNHANNQPENNAPKTTYDFYVCFFLMKA
jgi:hypothetical protein